FQVIEGVALLTFCDTEPLVLPAKPFPVVVPPYSAVMLCGLPDALSVDRLQDALFPTRTTAEHAAIVVAPSLKATEPSLFGFPAPDVTVAVNVRESPYVLGLEPAVRAKLVDVVLRAKKFLPVTLSPAPTANVGIGFTPVFA